MQIVVPNKVNYIINELYKKGYEAYVVGGCVRDSYLGKEPKDWDITTSASPDIVKKIFKKTIDTGIQHGTVTVMIDHEGFEVTTYRIDGEYEDSRHPKEVIFTSNLVEDLKRRDFTINAMAYNDITGLVDCFDGKGDLDRGIIRCVGDANERFDEDALRILRAIRFSAQLGFSIEEKTVEAIKEKAVNLSNISAERIKVELDKILTSKNPNRLINAYEYGVTNIILPEFDVMITTEQENPNHVYNVGLHTVKALENINNILKSKRDKVCVNKDELLSEKNQLMLRWAVLLHDVAKPEAKYFDEEGIAHFKMHEIMGVEKAKSVFNRLKFDRYTQDLSLRLIKYHDYRFSNTSVSMRRAASKIGKDIMELLFIVKEADIKAQNPITFDEKLSSLEESIKLFDNIKKENECLQIKDLVINGKDLIERGFKPGPEIGDCLDYLLNNVLDNPANNNVDKLLELVNSYVLNANK